MKFPRFSIAKSGQKNSGKPSREREFEITWNSDAGNAADTLPSAPAGRTVYRQADSTACRAPSGSTVSPRRASPAPSAARLDRTASAVASTP